MKYEFTWLCPKNGSAKLQFSIKPWYEDPRWLCVKNGGWWMDYIPPRLGGHFPHILAKWTEGHVVKSNPNLEWKLHRPDSPRSRGLEDLFSLKSSGILTMYNSALKHFEKLISTAMFSKRNKICNYPGWFHPWIKPLAPSPTNALNKSGKTSTNHKTKHSKHANKCEKRKTCKHITSKIKKRGQKWSKKVQNTNKSINIPSSFRAISSGRRQLNLKRSTTGCTECVGVPKWGAREGPQLISATWYMIYDLRTWWKMWYWCDWCDIWWIYDDIWNCHELPWIAMISAVK